MSLALSALCRKYAGGRIEGIETGICDASVACACAPDEKAGGATHAYPPRGIVLLSIDIMGFIMHYQGITCYCLCGGVARISNQVDDVGEDHELGAPQGLSRIRRQPGLDRGGGPAWRAPSLRGGRRFSDALAARNIRHDKLERH